MKKLDSFSKNIIIVFAGTTLFNFLNLLYQLLVAHKFSVSEFAAFNSLLSIYLVIASPLGTIQMAVAKYCAEFSAQSQVIKLKLFLSGLFYKANILAILTLLIFWLAAGHIIGALKIPSVASGYILAFILALAWPAIVLQGGVQGLELFWWLSSASIVNGILKLTGAFIFIILGYSIAGVLGAFLISSIISIGIYYLPLRQFISINLFKKKDISAISNATTISYRQLINYLFPVAISNFCFMNLISSDMILVKYFFAPYESGLYSLAQMVGKIFLFLPGAISIVMFPRTSNLNAKNLDTVPTLKRSLSYVFILCVTASIFYNLFPNLVLKILTGKVYPESIILGRLFSISMTFFTLLYIFISYFLSIKDFRFIKYLVIFTALQFVAIALFHKNLYGIQVILCINSILLFCIHFFLIPTHLRGVERKNTSYTS